MSTPFSSASLANPDGPSDGPASPAILWVVSLDGRGGARDLNLDPHAVTAHLAAADGEAAPLWVHIHREWESADLWLKSVKVPRAARRDLLAGDTRPDALALGEGLLVNLRGVNLNPGAEPEDMVALRLWVTPRLVVSARARSVKAVQDVRAQLKHGYGPLDAGGISGALALALADRMQPFLLELSDSIYDLDERDEILGSETQDRERDLEEELHQARLDIVGLRRYLAPQQAALSRLQSSVHPVLTQANKETLGIALNAHTRHLEDLDSLRDQAALLRDRIQQRAQERTNRVVYRMSLMAGVFLPLTFITGLLGVNLGGIPGAETNWGFWILCGLLVVLVGVEWFYIRRSDRFRER
ncbi:MAG: zinc transporter ZntB [Rhodospirillum sp.]|nr:zinc transporter ZntB [Rhodospirillum sp.]MCF8490638.1 zinc transporter ZntB [Rhodospirillum sp.]MCF8500732.1 zinc transporter ZntB [Rhodospirillum sp.]